MKPFQKWLLVVSSGLTGLTGVVYWWIEETMEPMSEWAVINHPLQPWALKAHILVAPALVFAVGLIALEHIWKHFKGRVRRGRRSGVSAMLVVGPMIASGYLIQVVTATAWRAAIVWAHLVTGIAFLAAFVVHQRAASRR